MFPTARDGWLDYQAMQTNAKKDPSNKKVIRIAGNPKKSAIKRDGYKCVLTDKANPDAAHIFPHSALGEVENAAVTRDSWRITKTLVDPAFNEQFRPFVMGPTGFEHPGNLMSFEKHLHMWLDRCFWCFEPKDREDDTTRETAAKFRWLPGDFADELKFPNEVSPAVGLEKYVRRIYEALETARLNNFPARAPLNGSGFIGAQLRDGKPLLSGHIFAVQHTDVDEAVLLHGLLRLQWVVMKFLMLRGVGPQGDDDDDDDKSGPAGKARKRVRQSTDSGSDPRTPTPSSTRSSVRPSTIPRTSRGRGRIPLASVFTGTGRGGPASPATPATPASPATPATPATPGGRGGAGRGGAGRGGPTRPT
uniref:WGS project CBME000000000 data, contig CS3487_c000046 n=1 Tax=Fusarium pseudograminearum CS3487 TaxID=1318458 RepID=A0A096PC16_FUSPS|nr:unnamed protein product [Fusarium pseudograminearum CS3487]